jgi:diguanylate cyclase (GGDEF)-like protein
MKPSRREALTLLLLSLAIFLARDIFKAFGYSFPCHVLYFIPIVYAGLIAGVKLSLFIALIASFLYYQELKNVENFRELLLPIGEIITYIFLARVVGGMSEMRVNQHLQLTRRMSEIEKRLKEFTLLRERAESLERQVRLLEQEKAQSSNLVVKLSSLANEINSTIEYQKVLEVIIEMIIKLIGASRCSLFLLEPGATELQEVIRFDETGIQPGSRVLKVGEGIAGYVAQHAVDEMIFTLSREDVEKDYSLRSLLTNNPIPTVICAPLVQRNELIGLVNIEAIDKLDQERENLLTFLANFAAISLQNAKLFKKTQDLANFDGLTNLYTRRYFTEFLSKEIERAKRYHHELSLMMVDIDHFKKINDTYGHQIGDFVLKETAQVLIKNTRKVDLSARYGGEEFAIVLPETALENARVVGERIRKCVNEHLFVWAAHTLKVTLSVGVSSFLPEREDETLEKLIKRADAALYEAKETGRNRVCVRER